MPDVAYRETDQHFIGRIVEWWGRVAATGSVKKAGAYPSRETLTASAHNRPAGTFDDLMRNIRNW